MLTPILLFTIWSVSFTCIFGIAAIAARRQAIHSRSIARVDRIRRSFAETRIKLFSLVTSNKLKPESATFRYLYFLHTSVMRRQDMYDDMWKVFVCTILRIRESTGDRQIKLEASEWSDEVRGVVLETAEAVQLMIYEHFRPLRWLANIDLLASNLEGAKPDRFFIANTLENVKTSNSNSSPQQLGNTNPQVQEVEEFCNLIFSAAS
ncbi:hypothetical protein OMCYN_01874 [cyanobiont of Ornithocercus magnificus]|nr:hypothetical protein OMCYN_01874 [cyanobiont of Ornithocercus magnificus]